MEKAKLVKTVKSLFPIVLGIVLIDLSMRYVNSAGRVLLNQAMLLPLGVSFVFGFFHAQKTMRLVQFVDDTNYPLKLIYLSLIYTAWYNVVLLPLSGFAMLEWILFALVIFSDFLLAATGKSSQTISYIGSSDKTLMTFGAVMYVFKLIVYNLAPDNIYTESFVGNPTARTILLLFCVVGLICLLSFLFKAVKSRLSFSEKQKTAAEKVVKTVGKVVSNFFKLILSLIAGPAVIVVLFCVVFVAGIFIFAEAKAIGDDILDFVEPILKQLTSTGRALVVPGVSYFVWQFFVLASVLIFFFSYRHNLEKSAKVKIEKRLEANTQSLAISETEKAALAEKKKAEIESQRQFIEILADPEATKLLTDVSEEQ